MNNKIKTKSAFTLAEVLITLVIIGVVAALTIPTAIAKYQKREAVERLKRTYSAIAQVTNRSIVDNGPIDEWKINGSTINDTCTFVENYLLPYFSVMKYCKTDRTGDCDYKYTTPESKTPVSLSDKSTLFYLSDGTLVSVFLEYNPPYKTINLLIDINANKGPNKMGRDLFSLRYIINHPSYETSKGKLIPNCFGIFDRYRCINDSIYGCKSGNGTCCAAIIMLDGWQIKDDYPW